MGIEDDAMSNFSDSIGTSSWPRGLTDDAISNFSDSVAVGVIRAVTSITTDEGVVTSEAAVSAVETLEWDFPDVGTVTLSREAGQLLARIVAMLIVLGVGQAAIAPILIEIIAYGGPRLFARSPG